MRVVVAVAGFMLVALVGFLVALGGVGAGSAGADGSGDGPAMLGLGPFDASGVPEQYRDIFQSAAALCPEVPAAVMAAQVEQESQWDPRARSSVGATGIAQFMPGTWATAGRDANGDGVANPEDPADALPAMARVNCENLSSIDAALASGKITGDRLALTMAAYNAGLGAVMTHRGVPPYAETQSYVSHILDNVSQFSAAPAPGAAGAGDGNAAVAAARTYLGIPYVWGGESRQGLDCSGLVLRVVKETTGKSLPHLADSQIKSSLGADVTPQPTYMRPGDIVGFSKDGGRNYSHIGIYIGNRRMIHAPQTGSVVREASLDDSYWTSQTWKVKRF